MRIVGLFWPLRMSNWRHNGVCSSFQQRDNNIAKVIFTAYSTDFHYMNPPTPPALPHPSWRPAGCVETMSQAPLCGAEGRGNSLVEFLGMNCVICALLIMSRGVAWHCLLPDRMRRLSTQHNLLELPSSRAGGRLIANDNKLPMRIKLCQESSFHCCCFSHRLTVY